MPQRGKFHKLWRAAGGSIMALAISGLWAVPASRAQEEPGNMRAGEALAIEKQCFTCHAMDQVLIGPSYKMIAQMHAEAAEAMIEPLTQKVLYGGGGNWDIVPMVPNHTLLTEAEARALVLWILSLPTD